MLNMAIHLAIRVAKSLLGRRSFQSYSLVCQRSYNRPLSANELPRPAGISSMFRLPITVAPYEGIVFVVLVGDADSKKNCLQISYACTRGLVVNTGDLEVRRSAYIF